MSIQSKAFGETANHEKVTLYTITNKSGNSVSLLDYGATIQSIIIKTADGTPVDCTLGYNNVTDYENGSDCFGATLGRVGGRISNSEFILNEKSYKLFANVPPHHLHGGKQGFHLRMFKGTIVDDQTLDLYRLSPDMEEGYPGNLALTIRFHFDDTNQLSMHYTANSDADTLINFANHAYFNLSGEASGSIRQHELQIAADAILETGVGIIPTGRKLTVENTIFDFRTSKCIGQDLDAPELTTTGGYDHSYCLNETGMHTCASLFAKNTGIRLTIATDQPCMQLYSGNYLKAAAGKSGRIYQHFDGVALETQHYPDAIHFPEFPSIVLRKEDTFESETRLLFDLVK